MSERNSGYSDKILRGMVGTALFIGFIQIAESTGAYVDAKRVSSEGTTGNPQTRDLGHLEVGLNGNQLFSVGATMGVTGRLNRNSGLSVGMSGAVEVTGSSTDTGPFRQHDTNGGIGIGFNDTNVIFFEGQIEPRGMGEKPGFGIEGAAGVRFGGSKNP